MKALLLAKTLGIWSCANDDETVIAWHNAIARISFEAKTFKAFWFLINAWETVLWGKQTLANKGVNNLIKQMAIFNHKNKICWKAKNYLLKIIGGLKPPAPRLHSKPLSSPLSWDDAIEIELSDWLGNQDYVIRKQPKILLLQNLLLFNQTQNSSKQQVSDLSRRRRSF